jgi:hypothetical protein
MGAGFSETIDLDANFMNPSIAENADGDEEMVPIDLDKPLLFFNEEGL